MTVNRGSEWFICDLQIQTILDDRYVPLKDYYESIKTKEHDLWNTFVGKVGGEANALLFDSKEYFNNNSIPKKERANNYVRTTFAFIETFAPHLQMIGITDHNYYDDLLIDEFFDYSIKTTCKVLPGIEVNIAGIHLLIFFKIAPFGKDSLSDGLKTFLSKINIDSPKSNGVLRVSNESLSKVLQLVADQKGIYLFPHCNSSNGLFQERGKTDRTHLADVFNFKRRIILQANSRKSIDAVNEYIKKNATLKSLPICTIASDARSLNNFGKPDAEGNQLWIKAKPTFEGIKQILFEPEGRVGVGQHKPEFKEAFCVIDYIQFISPDGDKTFYKEPIFLNPNLNTVIGGKSSGKSLLLFYIGKTIDEKQVQERSTKTSERTDYNFETEIPGFDFKVVWKDSTEYRLSQGQRGKSRLITYIPQMHINFLAEKKGKLELNTLINSFLNENFTFKTFYDQRTQAIREVNFAISSSLNEYYDKRREISNDNVELKKLSDKEGYKKSIEIKESEITALKDKAEFKDKEEVELFERLTKQSELIQVRRKRIKEFAKQLNTYNVFLKNRGDKLKSDFDTFELESASNLSNDKFSTSLLNGYIKQDYASMKIVFHASADNLSKKLNKLNKLEDILNILAIRNADALTPFVEKNLYTQKIAATLQDIEQLQRAIDAITKMEAIIALRHEELDKIKINIFQNYRTLFSHYIAIRNEVNTETYSKIYPEDEIYLNASLTFDYSKFHSDVFSQLNKKGYLNKWLLDAGNHSIDDDNNYIFSEEEHLEIFEKIFDKLNSVGEADGRFNLGRDSESINKALLSDFFLINYTLKQRDEDILVMSPGKKGIILLILILRLSNAKHPILIDQPEDNLDNRTIYSKLKEFIKDRKKERQIVIVTHNANMVVPTDSENIIVANQSGQDKGKDNPVYRFDYVNGALEESFNTQDDGILRKMGIREHVCDLLEGGEEAFLNREDKYSLNRK